MFALFFVLQVDPALKEKLKQNTVTLESEYEVKYICCLGLITLATLDYPGHWWVVSVPN